MDNTRKEPSESGDSTATEPLLPKDEGNEKAEVKCTYSPQLLEYHDDDGAIVAGCFLVLLCFCFVAFHFYSRYSYNSTITDLKLQLGNASLEYKSLLAQQHRHNAAAAAEPVNSIVASLTREREELMQGVSSLKSRVQELEMSMEQHESLRRRKELDEVDVLSRKGSLFGDRQSITDKLSFWSYGYTSPRPYLGRKVSMEQCRATTQDNCEVFISDNKSLVGFSIRHVEDSVSLKGSWKAVVIPGVLSDGRTFRVSTKAPQEGVPLEITVYTTGP